ncbi:Structural maintenance of chromosomes protein 6 [Coniosporium apollinis]|uniref:Structural maintenance of chromosomes protein 6 n=1 Tax=Coniosporium apollinis TaxID=61459 RepID=A0ABQ9NVX1_9PEZI|nr:Structural maintenance of chromosomes protein 6 [Coniosporium apollinis]
MVGPRIPSKRTRAATEDDESELYDVQTASSNLRRASNKKQRLAVADEEDASEAYSSDRSDEASNRRNGYTISESEEEEEEDTDIDELEEEGDIQATQRYVYDKMRERKQAQNMPAESAIIEEVRCYNFMCHSKLEVHFGPLINFIIGHNGSGKSAVLTALTLCLGAKATSTNRGQNLKSFVKEGQEHATLSVKIKNQGPNAFKPDIYGKSIIVERHFSRNGGSGFKLKNAKDKLISSKRADLDDILDHYQLQIDNPMNVLSQDMARQFLNHSNPRDKYKFFIKGTQLEELDHSYREIEQRLDESEVKLVAREEDVKAFAKKKDEAIRKMEHAERQQALQRKIDNYGHQMAWAQVEEQEQKLREIDQQIQQESDKIAQCAREADRASDTYDRAAQVLERMQEEETQIRASKEEPEERLNQLKEQFDSNKEELRSTLLQQRDIGGELRQSKAAMAKIRKEIANERQRREGVSGAGHTQKLEEIQDARVAADEAKAEFEAHGQGVERLEENRVQAQQRVRQLEPSTLAKQQEVQECQTLIRNLTQGQGQWMNAYDPKLGTLLRAIENERGFLEKPAGPLGRHIRLLKPQWSSVLESSLGAHLNAFVVTSKQDQTLLSGLMQRTQCHSTIFIGKSTPIDTSRNEPDAHLDTWMRVLRFDNDAVRNQLIINQSIEQTVLIEKRRDAMDFMYGGARPVNVKVCMCLNDESKRGWGLRLTYSGAGSEKIDPVAAYTKRPRMQTDVEAQIQLETEKLQQLRRAFSDAEQSLREARIAVKQCDQALVQHRRQQKDLQLRSQQADELWERLNDELEAEMPSDGKIEALEMQLQETQEGEEFQENAFQDAVDQRDRINQKQRELKTQMDEIQAEITATDEHLNKVTLKVQQLSEKRQKALYEKNRALQATEDARLNKQAFEERRQEQADRVTEFDGQARQVSGGVRVPVDPNETTNSLDKKLEKLINERDEAQRRLGGTREELATRALEASAIYETALRRLRVVEKVVQSLKYANSRRRVRWNKFRHYIANRARVTFAYLLAERKFRGSLNVDHVNKLLDIQVEPDITKASDKGRQTKTLSGGEKSFSTICLLLSLWDAMGSPIRCLDEFDVFMDNVNRDVSMRMIIEAARAAVSRQFVFITPQAMGNVNMANDVKIIKMSDPERGQTTLPFGS